MIGRNIAPRYAKALFEMSSINNSFDRTLEDFDLTTRVFQDNPRLITFLKTPQLSFEDKKKVIGESFKGKFSLLFMNFLLLLIRNGRIDSLMQIEREYCVLVNQFLKIWEADIVTAVPIDDESEAKLKKKLEEVFHKKIKINKKIDPKILGAAILIMENEMLDWSVTGRLRKLKDYLKAKRL